MSCSLQLPLLGGLIRPVAWVDVADSRNGLSETNGFVYEETGSLGVQKIYCSRENNASNLANFSSYF